MVFLKNLLNQIILNTKGKGNFNKIIWLWGGIFYCLSFSIFFNININSKNIFWSNILVYLLIIYAVWHIYITIINAPKNPILSKDEKELKKLKIGGFQSTFFRKLFLQEPITKMKNRNIIIIIDIFFLLHFISLIK